MNNPKSDGSGIIDCIPQKGKCPMECNDCFYNEGFYLDIEKDLPLLPSIKASQNKVVRMNSGYDSHFEKELVIRTALNYENYFFNTSYPDQDFPGPVVITLNPSIMTNTAIHILQPAKNLMFFRFRANTWNIELAKRACKEYCPTHPIVLTFMRYKSWDAIIDKHNYSTQKHILNSYISLDKGIQWEIREYLMHRYGPVYLCGTYWSSLCKHCGNCLREYFRTIQTMEQL